MKELFWLFGYALKETVAHIVLGPLTHVSVDAEAATNWEPKSFFRESDALQGSGFSAARGKRFASGYVHRRVIRFRSRPEGVLVKVNETDRLRLSDRVCGFGT